MKPFTENTQLQLAKSYLQTENQLKQESKIAFLKVQSWHFATKTPEIGRAYLSEAASMINKSLLCFVPNSFVLSEEGYYLCALEN
jgi:hypothetical protein